MVGQGQGHGACGHINNNPSWIAITPNEADPCSPHPSPSRNTIQTPTYPPPSGLTTSHHLVGWSPSLFAILSLLASALEASVLLHPPVVCAVERGVD